MSSIASLLSYLFNGIVNKKNNTDIDFEWIESPLDIPVSPISSDQFAIMDMKLNMSLDKSVSPMSSEERKKQINRNYPSNVMSRDNHALSDPVLDTLHDICFRGLDDPVIPIPSSDFLMNDNNENESMMELAVRGLDVPVMPIPSKL